MTGISDYSQQIATLIDALGSGCFPAQLAATLRKVTAVDDANITFYPHNHLPISEYSDLPEAEIGEELALYLSGPFLLDPYYLAAVDDRKFGFFHMSELVPDGFEETEYYKTYFLKSGVHDECCYLLSLDDDGLIVVALARIDNPDKFNTEEFTLLKYFTPVISSLCKQHWRDKKPIDSPHNMGPQILSALDRFGRSLLTKRECQVINQVLLGYSSKTIAVKLSISVQTVKLHRKHAYAKLHINSQAELFHLFLESVIGEP
jgi:DNA-binding CsgD family transcriptional regulator